MANRNARSNFEIYDTAINAIDNAARMALYDTAEALHTEVIQAQVVPRATGQLQGDKFHVDDSRLSEGEADLAFEDPYARRLYYHPEYNFQKTENPNAKGKWLEDWMDGGSKENVVKELFAANFKRRAGL